MTYLDSVRDWFWFHWGRLRADVIQGLESLLSPHVGFLGSQPNIGGEQEGGLPALHSCSSSIVPPMWPLESSSCPQPLRSGSLPGLWTSLLRARLNLLTWAS